MEIYLQNEVRLSDFIVTFAISVTVFYVFGFATLRQVKTLAWQNPGQNSDVQELTKIIINYVAGLKFMIEEIINNPLIQLLVLILSLIPLGVGIKRVWDFCIKSIASQKEKKETKQRRHYYSVLNSLEFQDWRDRVLLHIYGEKYFTKVFNVSFPAFVIKFDKYYSYKEFKQLYSKDDLFYDGLSLKELQDKEINVPDIHDTLIMNNGLENEIRKKKCFISEYEKILGKSVKFPKLIGFMLDHYLLNEKKQIQHIYPKIGDYALNLYSSHILEYELLRAYEKVGNKKLEEYNLWDYLPFRKYIHQSNAKDNSIENVLYTGNGRYSLFSVQCFIMFKDKDKNKYSTILMKRATDPSKVAAKIGFYQFPPAGGFELYEKESIHTGETITENYSLRKAIFREYLEEIFGIEDFKRVDSSNQETTNNIIYHDEVQSILSMIDKGTATFELIGVAVDLVCLRHELSFILKIDDESYSCSKHFCPNDEFTREQSIASKIRIPVSNIENLLNNNKKINQGSALLYSMVKEWCNQRGVNL